MHSIHSSIKDFQKRGLKSNTDQIYISRKLEQVPSLFEDVCVTYYVFFIE